MLVANGANPNLLDGNGVSPLTRAVLSQNQELVKLLVEKGAKINALDGDGYLPFHDTRVSASFFLPLEFETPKPRWATRTLA